MVVIISGPLLTGRGISRAVLPVGRCWCPGWTRTEAEKSRLINMYTYNKLWGQSAQRESSCPGGDNGDPRSVCGPVQLRLLHNGASQIKASLLICASQPSG